MEEPQMLAEEAKCAGGSLAELPLPQSLGEQCAEVAVKREPAFEARMGLGSQGSVDVSRAASSDV